MTTHVRVDDKTRWALKVAGAWLDCTIAEVLARVEKGDKRAIAAWQRAAREVAAKEGK